MKFVIFLATLLILSSFASAGIISTFEEDVLNVSRTGDKIHLYRYVNDELAQNLTIEVGLYSSNTYYPFAQVFQTYPEIQYQFIKEQNEEGWKWAPEFTNIPQEILQENPDIVFKYIDHYGFNLANLIESDLKWNVGDFAHISFQDLLDTGFTLTLDQQNKMLHVGNLSAGFSGGVLTLDPHFIDSTASALSNQKAHIEKMALGLNGELYLMAINSTLQMVFYNSSDVGETWQSNVFGTVENHASPTVIANSTGGIHVFALNDSVAGIVHYYSDDGGETLINILAFPITATESYTNYDIAIDQNDIIHMCLIDTIATDDTLYYANFSGGVWSALKELNDDSADASNECDIAVDAGGTVYVIASGRDGDDIDLFVSNHSSWGSENSRITIHSATAGGYPDIECLDYQCYATWSDGTNVYFGNTTDTISWGTKNLASTTAQTQDSNIAINANGNIEILYNTETSPDQQFSINSTGNGDTWNTTTLRYTRPDTIDPFGSAAGSNYPTFNRPTDRINYFVLTGTYEISYANYSISFSRNYELSITDPNSTDATETSSGSNITVTYDFQKDGVNQTSNVETQNITISGEQCTILQNENCIGTPTACSVFTNQSQCDFTGCTWTSADPTVVFFEPFTTHNNWTDPADDWDQGTGPSSCASNMGGACAHMDNGNPSPFELDFESDLSDATVANLTFRYLGTGTLEADDCLFYSIFDGAGWSGNLTVFCGSTGGVSTFNIPLNSTYFVSNFRFMVIGQNFQSFGEEVYIDDVNITKQITPICEDSPNACNTYTAQNTCTNSTGCTFENVTEESFTAGIGWEVNCTVGTGCSGASNDLFLSANFTTDDILRNDTVTGAISCGVVHLMNITFPTDSDQITIEENTQPKINSTFLFTEDGVNITENMTVNNITINDLQCTIATKDICEATADTCSSFEGDQASCVAQSGCFNFLTLPIRLGNHTTSGSNPRTITFSPPFNGTNYSVLATPRLTLLGNPTIDPTWSAEWNITSNNTFTIRIEEDTGGDASRDFNWLAIPYGEYNDSNNLIKCGNKSSTEEVGGFGEYNIIFDTPFPDSKYVTFCNAESDSADSPSCSSKPDRNKNTMPIIFINDLGGGRDVSDMSWCAFTNGTYVINGTLFRSGQTTEDFGVVEMDGQNFTGIDYTILAIQKDYEFPVECSCSATPLTNGTFNLTCEQDQDSDCGGQEFEYIAIGQTNADLLMDTDGLETSGACGGTPDACSTFSANASCVGQSGCFWNETQQLSNVNGEWTINYTPPILLPGTYDLIINVTYDSGTENISREDDSNSSIIVEAATPIITINTPIEGTNYTRNIFNITLNATISDPQGDNMDVFYYVTTQDNIANINDFLVFKGLNQTNGSNIIYNLTALPMDGSESNLAFLYHFDNISSAGENNTNIFDWSESGRNGTFNETIFNETGKLGWAAQFAVSNYINTSYSPEITETGVFSFGAWIYIPQLFIETTLIGAQQGNSSIGIRYAGTTTSFCLDDEQLSAVVRDADSDSFQSRCLPITYGNWHHAVVTFDGGGNDDGIKFYTFYIDGVPSSGQVNSFSDGLKNLSVTPFFIGAANNDGIPENFSLAQIDDAFFMNGRLLSDLEVYNLYRKTKGDYTAKAEVTDLTNTNSTTVDFSVQFGGTTQWILNSPTNDSSFLLETTNITQNATLITEGEESVIMFTSINSTSNKHGIVFKKGGVTNATDILNTYDAPVTVPTESCVALYHLDETPEQGENATRVFDFCNANFNNGTLNPAAIEVTKDWGVQNASPAALGGHVFHPSGVFYNNVTYVIFQGVNYDVTMVSYNHTTSNWSDQYRFSNNPLFPEKSDRVHGFGTVAIDCLGYLHTFMHAHDTQLEYWKSASPGDMFNWVNMTSNITWISSSYAQPLVMDDCSMYLHYRKGPSSTGLWRLRNSSGGGTTVGETWSDAIEVTDGSSANPATTLQTPWYGVAYKGYEGIIHFAYVDGVTTTTLANRTGLFYFNLNTSVRKFYNVSGVQFNTPLTINNGDAVKIHSEKKSEIPFLTSDQNNTPYLFNKIGDGGNQDNDGKGNYTFYKWTGSGWFQKNLTQARVIGSNTLGTLIVFNSSYIRALMLNGGNDNIEQWDTFDGGVNWTFNKTIFDSDNLETPYARAGRTKIVFNQSSHYYSEDGFDYNTLFVSPYPRSASGGVDLYKTRIYLYQDGEGFKTNEFPGTSGGFANETKLGGGLNFEHINLFVNASNHESTAFDAAENSSWSAWVKYHTPGVIVSKTSGSSGYKIGIKTDGRFSFWRSTPTGSGYVVNSTNPLTVDKWTHVAITYSNGDVNMYIDGALNTSDSSTYTSSLTEELFLGEFGGSFIGFLDDFALWNKSLSSSEITNLFIPPFGDYFWSMQAEGEEGFITTSEQRVFHIFATPPSLTINSPANNTRSLLDVLNITMNITSTVQSEAPKTVRFYAAKDINNWSDHGLAYFTETGEDDITFNFSAPITFPNDSIKVLLRLDADPQIAENATHHLDVMGGDNNGTGIRTFIDQNGKIGRAININGTGENRIEVSTDGLNHTQGSIVFWAKVGNLGGTQNFFGHSTAASSCNAASDCVAISVDGSGNLMVDIENGGDATASTIAVNEWTHMALTYTSDSYTFYVNGENVSAGEQNGLEGPLAATFDIGNDGQTSKRNNALNGSIDEFSYWNITLDPDDITNMYRWDQGTYFWKVNVTDPSGGTNQSETRQLTIEPDATVKTTLVYPQEDINVTVDLFFNFTINVTCEGTHDCQNINTTLFFNDTLLNVTEGDTPFYTNESNPRSNFFSANTNTEITFWVNATGITNKTWSLITEANITDFPHINAFTSPIINITIVEVAGVTDSCTYPGSGDHTFLCSDNCIFTEEVDLLGNNWEASGPGTITGTKYLFNYGIGIIIGGCQALA